MCHKGHKGREIGIKVYATLKGMKRNAPKGLIERDKNVVVDFYERVYWKEAHMGDVIRRLLKRGDKVFT